MITERERQLLRWIEKNPLISQQELAERAGITRSSVAVHISNLMKKGLIRGKGYILQQEPYVVVIGGANMDISGRPFSPLVKRDSNPGLVTLSPGGVGRNIAQNLSLLGEEVKFITALGEDAYATQLAENCRKSNIDITDTLIVPGGASSTYVYIANDKGDMELAISDMQIYEELTPQYLEKKADLIENAELCIMDTNLSGETVRYIAETFHCPLFCDPVSTAKSVKLSGVLGHIHTLKPNLLEAEMLSGIKIQNAQTLKDAAEALLDTGMEQIFISMGKDGVYCANHSEHIQIPCFPVKAVNTTGAGDSFMAAIAWGWMQGFSLEECARAGSAAAAICINSEETISSQLSRENLLNRMNAREENNFPPEVQPESK